MYTSYKAVKRRIPSLNNRFLSIDYCLKFCDKENIIVSFCKTPRRGHHVSAYGQHFILIRDSLCEEEAHFVLWHELIHYLLHAPEQNRVRQLTLFHNKQEFEANALASIARFPKKQLKENSICELSNFEFSVLKIRQFVFLNFKL